MSEIGESNTRVLLCTNLDLIGAEQVAMWLTKLPGFRRGRAESYRFHDDKVRSAAAFFLLAMALGYMPRKLLTGTYGKPALDNDTRCFNISHSGGMAAAVISDSETGVDVEVLAGTPPEVMEMVFTRHERWQIEAAADPARTFCRLWTLKESYIKAIGLGMSYPLQEVEFTVAENTATCSDSRYVFTDFALTHGHASVCASESCDVRSISAEELIDFIASRDPIE